MDNGTENRSTAPNLYQAAKLAKDIARVAAGDMSAIKDILLNETFWKIIICFVLIISLTGFIMGGWLAAIIEFIAECWEQNWELNWEEQAISSNGDAWHLETTGWWVTLGHTFEDTVSDCWDMLTGCSDQVAQAGVAGGAGRDNTNINSADAQAAGRNPEETDYETTLKAVHETPALNEALIARLDMIKGRVKQRGIQINEGVKSQYTGEAWFTNGTAETIIKWIQKTTEDGVVEDGNRLIVFTGYDTYESSKHINIDTSVFNLSDLQALKVLAIFCVQHDCQLTDMDMWTLMDYCGWFDEREADGALDDYSDSIYSQVMPDIKLGSDIDGLGFKDEVVMGIEFPSLRIPVWNGTCMPQWAYEEIAQIRHHNNNLQDGEYPWGTKTNYGSITYQFQRTELPALPTECVNAGDSAWYYYEYRAINQLTGAVDYAVRVGEGMGRTTHYNGEAVADYVFTGLQPETNYTITYALCKLTPKAGNEGRIYFNNGSGFNINYEEEYDDITIVEEKGVLETFTTASLYGNYSVDDVQMDKFFNLSKVKPFGIVDKLYYSTENNVTLNHLEVTTDAVWTEAELIQMGLGEAVKYWEDYVWAAELPTAYAGVVYRSEDGVHSYIHHEQVMNTLERKEIAASSDYYNYLTKRTIILNENLPGGGRQFVAEVGAFTDAVFTNLKGSTEYSISYKETLYIFRYDKDGNQIGEPSVSETVTERNTFTTYYDKREIVLYSIYTAVNVTFEARSVDDIAFDLLGIWPGALEDTVKTTEKTSQMNLIGKTTLGGKEEYSYCLLRGDLELVVQDGPIMDTGSIGNKLRRPKTVSYTASEPFTTVITVYEYGISTKKLTKLNQIPTSGWKTVDSDGDQLVFDITPGKKYYTYMRITVLKQTLQENGTVNNEVAQYLFKIEEFKASATEPGSTSTAYANGQLGNDLLKYSWDDLVWNEELQRWDGPIIFVRQQSNQYETYVDLVMALCELLGVSYDDWDPAVQRAKDLNYKQ